ncbi:trypsin-like serine peptidase [Streptomyces xiaopingdaonensis]|uniref:trypsin-like serine peptidase n=1 Tax=Streptomyces xiaopingdaonensis TaxID=1565415 RepID=UPI000310F325|nr:trypsin-like peptidase domain-containing protein [Streptomyces xiaopingdaonensis]
MTRSRGTGPARKAGGGLRAVAAAACAGGLLLAGAQLYPAAAQPAPQDGAVRTGPAVNTPASAHSLDEFWTAERMRGAVPLDLAAARSDDRHGKPAPRGEPRTVGPRAAPAEFPEPGGEWTGEGVVSETTGRVFFTHQGRTASCSGSAVTSENASTVVTAGHCVKMDGEWHTDWVFVPGYRDGEAPHGTWPATTTLTTPQWEASEDIDYDIGAAVVEPLEGTKLTDAVGGQGLAFNTAHGEDMYAFGYPAAEPYDGERLAYCSGTAFQDPLLTGDHGLDCDMTGGSSGGPWFTQFDEETGGGLLSSVNSFGYVFLPDTMFGPYFGAEAEALYDEAQTTGAG